MDFPRQARHRSNDTEFVRRLKIINSESEISFIMHPLQIFDQKMSDLRYKKSKAGREPEEFLVVLVVPA